MARFLEIATALDDDGIVLQHISGNEELGCISKYQLSLISRSPVLTTENFLGTNATVGIEMGNGSRRFINGYITGFSEIGETTTSYFEQAAGAKAYLYKATLHTWPWLLTKTSNCRIFQEKTVIEILKELLQPYAFAQIDTSLLRGQYRKWDYCCQYRETDSNFLNRMCEQEGITYFFRHENGKHALVLTDSASCYRAADGYADLMYAGTDGFVHTGTDAWISSWRSSHELVTGKFALTDFNEERPKADLAARATVPRQYKFGDFELFDYPGEYETQHEGESYARIRLEEVRAKGSAFHGKSSARGIGAGIRFTLKEHPNRDMNQAYLITGFRFEAANPEPSSGDAGRPSFDCDFDVIAAGTQYRAPRTASKPLIPGVQTAYVVGPAEEEIYTDSLGRVKVQFHWDRWGKGDDKSSCWVRVAQSWAGKKWGAVHIPRVGHEVVVEFLDGDPDRPLITGSVYNGESGVPFDYPGEKTRSGIRTKTYKGTGFNEISFEDRPGQENIYLHAEKDHEIRIKNDRKEHVGGESQLTVGRSFYEKVAGESHHEVGKDRFIRIGAEDHLEVAGDQNNKLGGSYSLNVGEDWHLKTGINLAAEAGASIHVKAGMSVVIEAEAAITLKVGGSFVTVGPAGIYLSSPFVHVNSGGSVESGSGAQPESPKSPLSKQGNNLSGGDQSFKRLIQKPSSYGAQSIVLKVASDTGAALCEVCNKK